MKWLMKAAPAPEKLIEYTMLPIAAYIVKNEMIKAMTNGVSGCAPLESVWRTLTTPEQCMGAGIMPAHHDGRRFMQAPKLER